TDNAFHGVGLAYFGRERYEDLGRYYVTRRLADSGKFKTPSLRDVPRTGPYMHRGAFTLPGVVNMLNAGMPTPKPANPERPDPLFPEKSPLLKPLGLSPGDVDFLVAFLQSLGERPQADRPR
ncbi:MAG: cytochrome-c peroxidase, partial [Patescibacteria group bacterium]|nr:cytochrome-c peroxidase [Patescibacteria group bacterium]